MKKQNDKISIVKAVQNIVSEYNDKLIGRVFLYVFDGHFIEVIFRKEDFLHLTGVDTKLSSKDFYKNALRGYLQANQIFFSKRHPYDLCRKKIEKLKEIISVTNSNMIILEELTTTTCTYKFGVTDLEFTVCLNRNADSSHYNLRSLRIGDSFSKAKNGSFVNFIFSKNNTERFYSTMTYHDGTDINSLPDEIMNMLDNELKSEKVPVHI